MNEPEEPIGPFGFKITASEALAPGEALLFDERRLHKLIAEESKAMERKAPGLHPKDTAALVLERAAQRLVSEGKAVFISPNVKPLSDEAEWQGW